MRHFEILGRASATIIWKRIKGASKEEGGGGNTLFLRRDADIMSPFKEKYFISRIMESKGNFKVCQKKILTDIMKACFRKKAYSDHSMPLAKTTFVSPIILIWVRKKR